MTNENKNKKVKKQNSLGHDMYISKLLNYFTLIFPFDNKQLINDSVFCMNWINYWSGVIVCAEFCFATHVQ